MLIIAAYFALFTMADKWWVEVYIHALSKQLFYWSFAYGSVENLAATLNL